MRDKKLKLVLQSVLRMAERLLSLVVIAGLARWAVGGDFTEVASAIGVAAIFIALLLIVAIRLLGMKS
jgi:hypothetical protein